MFYNNNNNNNYVISCSHQLSSRWLVIPIVQYHQTISTQSFDARSANSYHTPCIYKQTENSFLHIIGEQRFFSYILSINQNSKNFLQEYVQSRSKAEKIYPIKHTLSDKILSDKIFDTKPKFRQFCPIFA